MIRRILDKVTEGIPVFSRTGISTKDKFFLALPIMPHMLVSVLIHNAFIKYYTDMIGLKPEFVGLIYLVFGIWNAVNDPLMGILIDRFPYRPGRGKYVYLLKVTAPVITVSVLCMVLSSPGWNDWVIFWVFLLELFVFDTAHTAFGIGFRSYQLIAAPTKEERVDVSVIQGYLSHLGGFLATIIPTLLLVGESSRTLVAALFSGVIAINVLLYAVSLRRLRDTPEMYTHAEGESIESILVDSRRAAWRILRSKPFLTYLGFALLASGATGFYFTPFLYYMDKVLEVSGFLATVSDVMTGLSVFALFPLMGILVKRLGSKRLILLSMVPTIIGFAGLIAAGSYWQATFCYCLAMVGIAGVGVAGAPLMGAIIDEDEMTSGDRKAGLYLGLFALLTIPASGIQAMIFTTLIGIFGYDGSAPVQTARALLGIRIGAGLVPVLFCILGIIPMLLFPIDLERERELSDFSETARRARPET